jgi:myo-inositol 2-dehydrogenase/D-chiro-inositol 1-dehydrogenase
MATGSSSAGARPLPAGLTVGVIGAGTMAHTHLAAWRRLSVPAVVYSPSGRAASFAGDYAATTVTGLDELIARSRVVDICSPTGTHRAAAERALAAGRHVICEKPLALTHDDAAAIISAAETAGVQLHVAHVVRYFAAYAAARALVLGGAVGTVRSVRLRRTGAAPKSAWFHDDDASGGVLMDQMIHDFDYARWLLGEVDAVSARTEAGRTDDGQPTVRATAVLTHASGATSQLTGGWLAREAPFTTSLTVTGDAAEIRHTNARSALDVARDGTVRAIELGLEAPYDAQLAEFAAAIGGGPVPRVTPADALAAVDLTLAARRSAATGQPVSPRRPAG